MNRNEYVVLYERDLDKLKNEVAGYLNDDQMWLVLPGTINSGGNLAQHLIGNLRTYIGLALGNVPYQRNREAEFGERLFSQDHLLTEISILKQIVRDTLLQMSDEDLQNEYPHDVLAMFPKQSVGIILSHLLIHLGYHSGQINYHRRFTGNQQSQL